MEVASIVMAAGAAAISLLLALVAYFLKSLHVQLQAMDKDFRQIATQLAVLDERLKNASDETHQRIKAIETRVSNLEEKLSR